jgi:LmbE family N-acetylglucosaminyl deacetylase
MQFTGPKPFRLDNVDVPKGLTVTVLAPHPDDFDAIGATLRRLRDAGNRIHLAVLSSCSGVEDSFCSPPTLEQKRAIREQEQRDSCRFFGLPDDCLAFPRLTPTPDRTGACFGDTRPTFSWINWGHLSPSDPWFGRL